MRTACLIPALWLAALLAPAGTVLGQAPPPLPQIDLEIAGDGVLADVRVEAIAALPGGEYLVGGINFGSTQDPARGEFFNRPGVVKLSADGSVDEQFRVVVDYPIPSAAARVRDLVYDPNLDVIVIVGEFQRVNGVPRQGFAVLSRTGQVLPPRLDVRGGWAMRLLRVPSPVASPSDSLVVAVGIFETVQQDGGPTIVRDSVAMVDLAALLSGQPAVGPLASAVESSTFIQDAAFAPDGRLYLATWDGLRRFASPEAADFEPAGSDPDVPWDPLLGADARSVLVLQELDGTIDMLYVGGRFDEGSPAGTRALARYCLRGCGTPGWTTGWRPLADAQGSVNRLAHDPESDALWVGGFLGNADGTRDNLMRFGPAPGRERFPGVLPDLSPGGVLDLEAVPLAGGTTLFGEPRPGVLAGGSFQTVEDRAAGTPREGMPGLAGVVLDEQGAGTLASTLPYLAPLASVEHAVQASDGGVIIAGRFSFVGGQSRARLARITPQGEVDPDWRNDQSRDVVGLAADGDGWVYVVTEGETDAVIRRYEDSGTGARDDAWVVPPMSRFPGDVALQAQALAVDEAWVYLGGDEYVSSLSNGYLMRFSRLDGGPPDPSWGPQLDGPVHRILPLGGGVVAAAGAFTQADGQARAGLAAFAGNGSLSAWDPQPDGEVSALAHGLRGILLGGSFQTLRSQPRPFFAEVDPATGAPFASPELQLDGPVRHIASRLGSVYLSGEFSRSGVLGRRAMLAWDAITDTLAPDWDPQPEVPPAGTLATPRGVDAYGSFLQMGGEVRRALATLPGVGSEPLALALQLPADGASFRRPDLPVEFRWSEVVNAERYRLHINDDFGPVLEADATGLAGYRLRESELALLGPGRYSWSVVALNEFGDTSAGNGPFEFTVAAALPGSFAILSPADGSRFAVDAVPGTFSWSEAADAESYSFTLGTADGVLVQRAGITDTSISLDAAELALIGEGEFRWSVRAVNGEGEQFAEPSPAVFSVVSALVFEDGFE